MTMQTPAEQASPDRTLSIELHLTDDEYRALCAYADRCGYRLIETAAVYHFFRGLQEEQRDGRPRERTSLAAVADERGEA